MTLTLTVLRCPPTVTPETRQVSGGDFSIGRGPDNNWVLPDPDKELSKQHCVIAFRKGTWQVGGTSTNGTFLNRDAEPLEAGPPRTLEDGDRLHLGVYEIEVRVAEAAQTDWRPGPAAKSSAPSNPFDDDPFATNSFGSDPVERISSGPMPTDRDSFSRLSPDFDPLRPDEEDEAFAAPPRADHSSAVSDALHLPSMTSVLPDDWDLDHSPAVQPPPVPIKMAPPVILAIPPAQEPASFAPPTIAPGDDLLAAFLRGAGMEPAAPPDPVRTMEQLGAAFRAVVSGIRRALIARAGVKREFRIEATEIRTHGNNLLKFSANDDDALAGLLGVGRRSDMTPEAAVADALTDMRLHELANMTAMQHAVRALVVRLGPERFRESESGGGLLRMGNRKARSWDAYETAHAEILHGLADDFDSVFGKQFARAYEQAIQELAATQKTDRR